jgi:phospholipid-transporting ATPase
VANIYFLAVAILQSIPMISPLQPFSAVAPFVLVIAVSMIREAIEDYRRYKSDRETNSMPCFKYLKGFESVPSYQIEVGDVVMVKKDQPFPCDLIMLSSSEDSGMCFIETSSLDGEKNLKPRVSFNGTSSELNEKTLIRLFNLIEAELPNSRLYQFSAAIDFKGEKCPLDKSNLLLSGAVLRNTMWVIGAAVYTGEETKLRMNLMKRSFKQSSIERKVNKFIIFIILLQILFCLIPAVLGILNSHKWKSHSYLDIDPDKYFNGFLLFFTYFLLLNTMLPISLIISLEIAKMIQGFFMEKSTTLYSGVKKQNCKVFSSSLNEELGMVKHIFTDKTGTLTCNRMKFRFCTIGKKLYGSSPEKLGPGVTYDGPKELQDDLFGPLKEDFDPFRMNVEKLILEVKDHKQLADQFMKCLCICHECLVDRETGKYIGPSPDEIALLETCKKIGFTFHSLSDKKINLKILPFGSKLLQISETFEHICTLEFNSDRKRNSVIVKDPSTGFIFLYTKGADNMILKRLSSHNPKSTTEKILADLLTFSQKGFRTLLLAFRIVGPKEFSEWKAKYDLAVNSILNRDEEIAKLAEEIENELILLGCTAVEDSLQDQVNETIQEILAAGIHVWMLTGDKLETAVNISKTCGLVGENSVVCKLKNPKAEKCFEKLEKFLEKIGESHCDAFLVIEGESLEVVFEKGSGCIEMFFKASQLCKTVVCCRVSPGQKKRVVQVMKERYQTINLAIGDGANDVSMILEANIGIGIFGEEGMQAVQASDFAIGEFRLLWSLMLQHGRVNYLRQSEMILYFFYKNMVFTLPQLFFAFLCFYSGQTIYDDWYITLYNMVFTALPLMMKAVLERDTRYFVNKIEGFDEKDLVAQAYSLGKENKIFTSGTFSLWILKGFFHAVLVFFIPFSALGSHVIQSDGRTSDFWVSSITSFTAVIFIVTVNLCVTVRFWTVWHGTSIVLLSLGLYFGFILLYDRLPVSSGGVIKNLTASPLPFLVILVCICLSFCVDVAIFLVQKVVFPNASDQLLSRKNYQKLYTKVAPLTD